MKIKNYIVLCVLFISSFFSYGQDGRSLILVHNYANKTAIDGIVNPTEGNIAYNEADKSFYIYKSYNDAGTTKYKWIVDAYYKLITTATGPLILDEDYYTVIVDNASNTITLPTAADYNGREYVIKNVTDIELAISDYNDKSNAIVSSIPAENVLKIQSDGGLWNQLNNYSNVVSSTATSTTGTTTTNVPIGTIGSDVSDHYASFFFTDSNANDTTNKIDMQYTEDVDLNTDWGFEISNVPYSNITINSLQVGTNITLPNANVEVTSFEVSPGIYTINIVFTGPEFYLTKWESVLVKFDQTVPIGTNNLTNCPCVRVYSL